MDARFLLELPFWIDKESLLVHYSNSVPWDLPRETVTSSAIFSRTDAPSKVWHQELRYLFEGLPKLLLRMDPQGGPQELGVTT